MSTINFVSPSAPMNEDLSSERELEQEGGLEETLEGEQTEQLTDQDGSNGGGGASDGGSEQGHSDSEVSTIAMTEVSETENSQETIPSTFFSAMAYSIEAFLNAIEAQQTAALMNIELYVDQVMQQQETAVALAGTIRQKFKLDAKVIMMDAVMSFVTAGISVGQVGGQYLYTKGLADQISDAHTERTNLTSNLDNLRPTSYAVDGTGGASTPMRPDAVMGARTEAKTRPHSAANPVERGLHQSERNQLARDLKDDINAVDHRISGLNATRQHYNSMFQIGAEIVKSTIQGALGIEKANFTKKIGEVEFNRTMYENVKDLISSLIQQIQGRISSSSKSMLDGVDTLRNAIRQFQG